MSFGHFLFNGAEFRTLLTYALVMPLFIFLIISLISDIDSLINKKECISNVPTTRLVREIVWYTNDILWQKGIKQFPQIKISYHKSKKLMGKYVNTTIVIYIRNHDDIMSIVNTILHEIHHFVQDKANPVEFARYEYYLKTFGHSKNPLEMECFKFADYWAGHCMTLLIKKCIIKQEKTILQKILKFLII
jgi:hypothetical protein